MHEHYCNYNNTSSDHNNNNKQKHTHRGSGTWKNTTAHRSNQENSSKQSSRIIMPFKRLSRSASRNQSMESIPSEVPRGTDEVTQRITNEEASEMKLYLTDTELNEMIHNREKNNEITETLNNPLGQLLVKLTNNYNKNIQTGDETEGPIQLNEICLAFKEGLKINREDVQEVLKESSDNLKEEMYNKELNFHLINPLMAPPKKYGTHPTLYSLSRNVDTQKMFPQNKARFSGRSDSIPITEFIFNMNLAQEKTNLSQIEFQEKLLSSTTGDAHSMIRTLQNEGDSIDAIYHKLICLYDTSPQPNVAKQELLRYKISKRSNLMKSQGKILELAAAAARIFAEGPLRRTYSNSEAAQCLIRALPPKSSQIVATQYNILISKKSQTSTDPPLFVDLILFLGPLRAEIDLDIQHNGANYESRDTRDKTFRPNNDRFKSFRGLQVNSMYVRPPMTQNFRTPRFQVQRRPFSVNVLKTNDRAITNKYMNNMYCSLCGECTHTSNNCYAMKRNGRSVPITPTQIACVECEKTLNKKLFHPPQFCFTKNETRRNNNYPNRSNYQGQSRA